MSIKCHTQILGLEQLDGFSPFKKNMGFKLVVAELAIPHSNFLNSNTIEKQNLDKFRTFLTFQFKDKSKIGT